MPSIMRMCVRREGVGLCFRRGGCWIWFVSPFSFLFVGADQFLLCSIRQNVMTQSQLYEKTVVRKSYVFKFTTSPSSHLKSVYNIF